MRQILGIFAFLLTFAQLAGAAPHRVLVAKPGKQDAYVQQGQFRGGDAGRNFIFHDLRRAFGAGTGIERYILEFTDGNGEVIKGRPGYYQITLDSKNGRVLLEFSQVLGSRFNAAQVQKAFAESPYIRSSKMTYDPEDSGLTLQLFLKPSVQGKIQAEAFEIVSADKGGRVAIDLRLQKGKL